MRLWVLASLIAATLLQQASAITGLLELAVASERHYHAAFVKLTAQETRVVEIFDGSGKVEKSRRTVADFMVQTMRMDFGTGLHLLSEFRSFREVDGMPVPDREQRLAALARDLANDSVAAREADRLNRETHRFDLKEFSTSDMTFTRAFTASFLIRKNFSDYDFRIVESLRVGDRDLVVLSYEEKPPQSPTRMFGVARGRLWLDGKTGQLWREDEETIMMDPFSNSAPVRSRRFEAQYTPGPMGLLTPERIVYSVYAVTATPTSKGNALSSKLRARVSDTYGPFQRFGVDVNITPLGPTR
jgi:hypothetical protein